MFYNKILCIMQVYAIAWVMHEYDTSKWHKRASGIFPDSKSIVCTSKHSIKSITDNDYCLFRTLMISDIHNIDIFIARQWRSRICAIIYTPRLWTPLQPQTQWTLPLSKMNTHWWNVEAIVIATIHKQRSGISGTWSYVKPLIMNQLKR